PVGKEQHTRGRRRLEAGQEVSQTEGLAAPSDVCERLDHHGVGSAPQLRQDPIPRPLVPRCARNPRPELHLLPQVAERALPVELARVGAPPPPCRTGNEHRDERCPQRPAHRSCPTLVDRFTNAVTASCAVLWLNCRSSFTT